MSINSKNTKAEILAAYKDLEKQKKSLELQIEQVQSKPVAVSSNIPSVNNSSTTKSNANLDLTKTIRSLEAIQGGFGSAVGNLSEQLIAEATQLAAVKMATAAEAEDLENLHQLTDIDDSTIDFLLDRYQELAKRFAEEYSRQQTDSDREIEVSKQEWLKEQQTHQKLIADRDETYRKSKQREQEEY